MKPFIRWVGGKTKLLPEIRKHVPKNINTYYEPFVGAGAVLLDIDSNVPAVANDSNFELINFYNVLKESPNELLREFQQFENNEETYYRVRCWDRQEDGWFDSLSPLTRAARFLYLNKTSFQGLWRVNQKGQHNVPYRRPKSILVKETDVARVSSRLQNVLFTCHDFETSVGCARPGDFVYFDPPYIPLDDSKAFVGYTDGLFHYIDQLRLRDTCVRLNGLGVSFLLSNSDTALSRELYKGFKIETVTTKRLVSAKRSSRGNVNEILVKNF